MRGAEVKGEGRPEECLFVYMMYFTFPLERSALLNITKRLVVVLCLVFKDTKQESLRNADIYLDIGIKMMDSDFYVLSSESALHVRGLIVFYLRFLLLF